jgi:hypothetical protein
MKIYQTKTFYRLTELIPGVLTWLALLLPVVLSFTFPNFVAYFVILFDFYWLIKSVNFSINIVRTYKKMRQEIGVDWEAECLKLRPFRRDYREIYQAIILLTYKEPIEVLRASIESYVKANFPKEKKILIFASEERDRQNATKIFNKLKKEFDKEFLVFEQTVHPKDLPGEIICKSANATWAGRRLREICDERSIKIEDVIVHNFDADTRVHPQYFAYCTYKFLTVEDPYHTSFQPIHCYDNNIWHVPALIRMVAFGSTFVLMSDCQKPKRFRNFSSRSNCFKTIIDINYWCVDAIPEDSRQYYDSLFKFKGRHYVEPLFIPVFMDAALADSYWGTFKNQYLQLRRWAWGCTDIPYLIKISIEDKSLSFWFKLRHILRLIEWHFSWATAPIFITFVGWLPILLNPAFKNTVLGYSLPTTASQILTLATVGLFISILLSLLMLPKRPKEIKKTRSMMMLFQWMLFPVVSILLSSLPAIDAQTRLLLGKYLEYRVTVKAVKSLESVSKPAKATFA